ncbi:TraL conjugative transposon family protein [Dysgonomonas sp. ZJ709]|uniref:TraL conjugative transposon family protein n=1 Tax=Dysgonomonas sp. ZJ709 TaxID=2709797 RepID=UPI0013EBAF25|nr:TraL conjugative transposon family protein [Dysgonomonas sp. ZJ709]
MKETIREIRYAIQDKIKDWCGEITPDKRLIFILVVIIVFTAINLYFTFSSIYNLGKKNAVNELIQIEHIKKLNPKQFRFDPQLEKEVLNDE